jgi:hypothetical protein
VIVLGAAAVVGAVVVVDLTVVVGAAVVGVTVLAGCDVITGDEVVVFADWLQPNIPAIRTTPMIVESLMSSPEMGSITYFLLHLQM